MGVEMVKVTMELCMTRVGMVKAMMMGKAENAAGNNGAQSGTVSERNPIEEDTACDRINESVAHGDDSELLVSNQEVQSVECREDEEDSEDNEDDEDLSELKYNRAKPTLITLTASEEGFTYLRLQDVGLEATLGAGSSTKKSIVQCVVGDKKPIYLCCLLPERPETCSLNLDFEEDEEVKFSVIGPNSIHLSVRIEEIHDD
ncbi:hypothetical protein RJ639_043024 [Escallonia herrerae]|uniref:peptidylprolyl isomerase n=1 Tax=Escallonia herrerae TaxID=1293975 RepID=A0AA88WB58_9ASTE|nr:hypothetical protein RJ639_043024 [Escallonia herrerae]